MKIRYLTSLRNNFAEIIFFTFLLLFSLWLMFSTFSYENGSMLIATKAWSDFGSHIPLIRSFSFGNNLPPQYPLFSGEPIHYHFLFYLAVGLLEKVGLRIDLALNLLSSLSFFFLTLVIYCLAKTLFKSKAIGILSVILFLFNGSLSFIEFFKTHPISWNTINDILSNVNFPSFGPYDGKIISAFWNLNIYTNQRHLALPLALLFLIILIIIKYEQKSKKLPRLFIAIFGILIGLFTLAHSSIFFMSTTILIILFLFLPRQRKSIFLILLIGGLISFPRILFLKETASYTPHIEIGYLIQKPLNVFNFIRYWFLNLGLSFILMPIGFLLSPKFPKKIFLAFLSLFLIGNLIQFTIEMASNHKFFNAFLIIGNMYTAFLIIKIWNINLLTKIITPFLIFLLVLSGIIDFFPIKNDRFMEIADYPKNPDVKWIMQNTPPNSTFLNTTFIYDPASLAGRKIFLGWPYFSWSLGYATTKRDSEIRSFLTKKKLSQVCSLLRKNQLDYVLLEGKHPDYRYDLELWKKLHSIYNNKESKVTIFSTRRICQPS